ncbi:MAG: hypothetical protein ABI690_17615 [Chloroflexota bacterium]
MTKKKNDFVVVYDEHDTDNPEKARKQKPPPPKMTRTGWIFLAIAFVFLSIGLTGIIAKSVLSSSVLPTLIPTATQVVVSPTRAPVTSPTRAIVITSPGVISTLPPTWTPTPLLPTDVAALGATASPTVLISGASASAIGPNVVAYVGSAVRPGSVSDDIFLLDMDTHTQIDLTNDRYGSGFPTWSPDGSQIVYASSKKYDLQTKRQLFIINMDGSSGHQLTFNLHQSFDFPSWLPDGKRLLATSTKLLDEDTDLLLVNVSSAEVTWLTDDTIMQSSAVWSPDGSRIVYSAYDGGNVANSALYIMNADGSGVHNISNRPGVDDSFPVWSSDSQHIAFVSSRDEPGNRDIYIMDADGGTVRRMTTAASVDEFPSWSPDGDQIIFSSDGILTLVSTYSGTIISQGIEGTQPAWRPRPNA